MKYAAVLLGLALVAGSAFAAHRVMVCEEFTATG